MSPPGRVQRQLAALWAAAASQSPIAAAGGEGSALRPRQAHEIGQQQPQGLPRGGHIRGLFLPHRAKLIPKVSEEDSRQARPPLRRQPARATTISAENDRSCVPHRTRMKCSTSTPKHLQCTASCGNQWTGSFAVANESKSAPRWIDERYDMQSAQWQLSLQPPHMRSIVHSGTANGGVSSREGNHVRHPPHVRVPAGVRLQHNISPVGSCSSASHFCRTRDHMSVEQLPFPSEQTCKT